MQCTGMDTAQHLDGMLVAASECCYSMQSKRPTCTQEEGCHPVFDCL